MKKEKTNIILLGATGVIGEFCLAAIKSDPRLRIVATSCYKQKEKLHEINKAVRPYASGSHLHIDTSTLLSNIEDEYSPENTIAINAIDGIAGLKASAALINRGYDIILSNKETIVSGGKFILDKARQKGITITSIDSEMFALSALIKAYGKENIAKYIITASGGPFLDYKKEDLRNIRPEDAAKHPIWKMGKNISIDSATLANKAIELVEARNLFDLPTESIKAVINKESIVHAMVVLNNGSMHLQAYKPNQTLAIRDALGISNYQIFTSPFDLNQLNIREIDPEKFPFITLGYRALESHTLAVVLASANEKARELFINGSLAFDEIATFVKSKMDEYESYKISSLSDVIRLDELVKE